jgi:hypothetical protein
MIARLSMMFVVLVVALTLVSLVQVQTGNAALWHHSYKGQVSSYDKAGNTVVINGKEGEKTFDLSSAKVDGTIRRNDTAEVKYDNKDGQMVASSVKVLEPRAGMEKADRGYGTDMDRSHGADMNRTDKMDHTTKGGY